MKVKWIIAIFIFILILRFYFPFEYSGINKINNALSDGNGDEFVMNIGMSAYRFSTVREAYDWVISHMIYEEDPNPPDIWTSSLRQYGEIIFQGVGKGDCDDYAILLCSLLRFHTSGGISEDRVWFAVNQIKGGYHAWVQYIDENGDYWILDPVNDKIQAGNPVSTLKFNDKMVLPLNSNKFRVLEIERARTQAFNEMMFFIIAPSFFITFAAFIFLNVSVKVDFVYFFYFLLFINLAYLIFIFLS